MTSSQDEALPGLLLQVDARSRISLGSLARYRYYLATVEDDGTIVLTPGVVMPLARAQQLTQAPTRRSPGS